MTSTKKFDFINILLLLGSFGITSVESRLSLRGLTNNEAETCSEEKSCWDTTKKECIEGTCQCKEGWISDNGNGCQDFNECLQIGDLYPCDHEGGYCVNHFPFDGMYTCHCSEGYVGFDDNGHGPERCITDDAVEIIVKETEAPTVTPTVAPSAVPSLYLPLCPLSEIDSEILTMKDVGSGYLHGGSTLKPTFEFELPKATQRLLLSFDFIEKGMWDGVGIMGDQNDFVGIQLESLTRDTVDIDFGGFHYGVSETMREGNEDGINWSVSSAESGIVNDQSGEQTHNVAVEIDSTKFSYESDLLKLIIDYNLEGQIDEWLDIENLKIVACMDSVPSVTPSEFPTSSPSNVPTNIPMNNPTSSIDAPASAGL